MPRRPCRILGLDVDGTLLDSTGTLRPRTLEAVSRAARAGIRPVLCTGRRYRKAVPIAQLLGIDLPLICNSGALVKESGTGRTLSRADLAPGFVAQLLELFLERDELAISFTDRPAEEPDFLVARSPTGRPLFDDYLERNLVHAEVDAGWADRADLSHYHLCAIGSQGNMEDLERAILDQFSGRAQTFVQKSPRYAGTMCEVLREGASKWSALLHLAGIWGIDPEEICAVGDDMNDLPMIVGAGFGVAMGQARPQIREAADFVTGSDDEDGVAMLIEDVLLA